MLNYISDNNVNSLRYIFFTNINPNTAQGIEPFNFNPLPNFPISSRYFQFFQSTHKHHSLPSTDEYYKSNNNKSWEQKQSFQSFIPEALFIPGYFHNFFITLSFLGNDARGSVFKVVHQMGDTPIRCLYIKNFFLLKVMWFDLKNVLDI